MIECVNSLPPDERVEFEKWDADRPEGVKTSEWSGFAGGQGRRTGRIGVWRERGREAAIKSSCEVDAVALRRSIAMVQTVGMFF
jgi:hypothetical protein